MAIGASQVSVLRHVLRQGLILALVGVGLGGALSAVVVPILAAQLMGLGTMNLASFVIVPTGLLVVSAAACYLPARRAASLDPIRALRFE